MPKLDVNAKVATARTWATGHVVAACAAVGAIGFVLGALLF